MKSAHEMKELAGMLQRIAEGHVASKAQAMFVIEEAGHACHVAREEGDAMALMHARGALEIAMERLSELLGKEN